MRSLVGRLTMSSVAVLATWCAQSASAEPPVHSVTGSGVVSVEGIVFRTTVAVHQDSDGGVWGVSIVLLDLSAFDLGKVTFRIEPTCLDVDGDSAWIGGIVTHSTNEVIVPIGENDITLVRDLGKNGQDVMHNEPFPPGTLCTDRPEFLESVVDRGNFKVR
jgi:hypothetical protein